MFRNTVLMLLSTILRFINAVLILVVLARFWGPETFGVFMYPFTLAGLVVILVDYGFNLQLVRDIGKNVEDVHRLTCRAIAIKSFLASIIIIVGIPLIIFLEVLDGYRILFVLLLFSNILNSYGLIFNLAFRGMGLFDKEVNAVSMLTAVTVILIGILIFFGKGPEIIAFALLLSKSIFMIYSWIIYRKVIGNINFLLPNYREMFINLQKGFPYAAHIALGTLYFSVDTIIIQQLLGAESVGIYQAGLRIMVGALVLTDVFSNVYLSRMAIESHNRDHLIQLGTQMTRHCLIVGVLGFVCMIGFPDIVVGIIYGSAGYERVISLFPLFGVVLFLRYFGASYGILLTVDDKQVVRTIGVGLSVIVSITMNIFLIPKYGLLGALYASIVTHVFLTLIYILFVHRQFKNFIIETRSWILIFVAISAGLLLQTAIPELSKVYYIIAIFFLLFVGLVGVNSSEYLSFIERIKNISLKSFC